MKSFSDALTQTVVTIGAEQLSLGALLLVDPDDLSREFAEQAARYAYLGTLTAKAEALYEEAKAKRELAYAEVDDATRTMFRLQSERYTEATVKGSVELHTGYQAAVQKELAALHTYKTMRALSDAMRQRGDMLVSLGATLRQEYEMTGVHINQAKEMLCHGRGT